MIDLKVHACIDRAVETIAVGFVDGPTLPKLTYAEAAALAVALQGALKHAGWAGAAPNSAGRN